MGAWGEGLQSNDTAWDAIGSAGFDVNGQPTKKIQKELEKHPDRVARYFKGWILKQSQAVLGLAEYFMDAGVDVKPVAKLVRQHIRRELFKKNLSTWRDPESRKRALLLLRDRLGGKKVDMEAIAASNEGLFSKMSRVMG